MVTVVLGGVSGIGKSTVMLELTRRLGWATLEGDALHPPGNTAKMAAGIPLTDEDRVPWLEAIAAWIGVQERRGSSSLVACSALKRDHRRLLGRGHPSVRFVQLVARSQLLEARIARRRGHFMPPSLLASQEAALQPLEDDEPGIVVDADRSPGVVAAEIVRRLGLQAAGTGAGTGKPSRR